MSITVTSLIFTNSSMFIVILSFSKPCWMISKRHPLRFLARSFRQIITIGSRECSKNYRMAPTHHRILRIYLRRFVEFVKAEFGLICKLIVLLDLCARSARSSYAMLAILDISESELQKFRIPTERRLILHALVCLKGNTKNSLNPTIRSNVPCVKILN
jgi:hypothetical protein